ncbi:hypothetical protein ABC733_01055 [Mangrovibacter sp. SLW1]
MVAVGPGSTSKMGNSLRWMYRAVDYITGRLGNFVSAIALYFPQNRHMPAALGLFGDTIKATLHAQD